MLCTSPGDSHPEGVFTLGDAQSFCGLTSKIPPLGSILNFDADVKKRAHVTQVKTASDVGHTQDGREAHWVRSARMRANHVSFGTLLSPLVCGRHTERVQCEPGSMKSGSGWENTENPKPSALRESL